MKMTPFELILTVFLPLTPVILYFIVCVFAHLAHPTLSGQLADFSPTCVPSPAGVLLIWHFSSPRLAKVTQPRDPPALHTPAQRFCYSGRDVPQGAGPQFIIGFLFSPLGYASNDMPVKAKRSTYNYSLPITVKKPGTLCLQKGWLALLCSPHPHRVVCVLAEPKLELYFWL